jgi:hypothetical protein
MQRDPTVYTTRASALEPDCLTGKGRHYFGERQACRAASYSAWNAASLVSHRRNVFSAIPQRAAARPIVGSDRSACSRTADVLAPWPAGVCFPDICGHLRTSGRGRPWGCAHLRSRGRGAVGLIWEPRRRSRTTRRLRASRRAGIAGGPTRRHSSARAMPPERATASKRLGLLQPDDFLNAPNMICHASLIAGVTHRVWWICPKLSYVKYRAMAAADFSGRCSN